MINLGRMAAIAVLLFFSSCQEEFEEVGGESTDQNIQAHSNTASLIEKATAHDGSYDNMVDGAGCFAIKFPYNVKVNGVDLSINSKDDLQTIKEILAQLVDQQALIDLVFPIVITLEDYSEINVVDQEQLLALVKDCIETGDDRIGCIDFVYPITLFTLDVDNQLTEEVTVTGDMEMRRFFSELEGNLLTSIGFPIQLKKSDGSKIEIDSVEELVAALEQAKKECDRVNLVTKDALDAFLIKCPLKVREVFREQLDHSEQYYGSTLTFSQEGTVVLTDNGGESVSGSWGSRETDRGVLLTLQFNDLVDFTLEWQVYKLEDHVLKLYQDNGNKIILKKWCDDQGSQHPDPQTLRALLQECEWVVNKHKMEGEETQRLLGHGFQFASDGSLTLGDGMNVSLGTWEVGVDNRLRPVLKITMENGTEPSFDWPLWDLTESRLKFKTEDGAHELVVLRICDGDNQDGDVVENRNFVLGNPWTLSQFTVGEDDLAAPFEGMEFQFGSDNRMEVGTADGPLATGLWRILRDSGEGLRFHLNFEGSADLGTLTDNWRLVSISATEIQLKDDSDSNKVKGLVFIRL